jgi:hypothetical protein
MSRRSVSLVKGAVLVGATFLLTAPQVLAGASMRAGDAHNAMQPSPPPQPVPVVRVVPVPAVVSVAVTVAPQPATGSIQVNLRGPDGQLRRFPLEGGREAIEYEQIVLRPGQSVTIRWVAAKPRSGQGPR